MSNLLHEGHHTDIMATKPVPPRPAPRLYLSTPLVTDPAQLALLLPALLGAADVAAVLLRLAPSDERGIIQRAKALAPAIQKAGAALLLDSHYEQVARAGADGANVSGVEAMQDAMPALKPDRILGVGGLVTRHDAMTAGEAGADYVLFGEPDAQGERPSAEAVCERLDWWAELFEPPCVGFAATLDEARQFATAGADFVLVGDLIWQDSRGPQAALREAADAIAQGFAASLAKATVKEE
jgi:thiamine-phosphate pyrophosphorylase